MSHPPPFPTLLPCLTLRYLANEPANGNSLYRHHSHLSHSCSFSSSQMTISKQEPMFGVVGKRPVRKHVSLIRLPGLDLHMWLLILVSGNSAWRHLRCLRKLGPYQPWRRRGLHSQLIIGASPAPAVAGVRDVNQHSGMHTFSLSLLLLLSLSCFPPSKINKCENQSMKVPMKHTL